MEKSLKLVFATILLCGIVNFGSCNEYGFPCDIRANCTHSKPYDCYGASTTPPTLGKCGCATPATMYFDPQRETCVVQAEKSGCHVFTNDGQIPVQCTLNAVCNNTEINEPGTCLCVNGTSADGLFCKPSYGMGPCTTSSDCSSPSTTFLTCRSSECTCRDQSVWDDVDSKCRGLFGGTCYNETTAPGPCSDFMTCESNLCVCDPTYLNTTAGICKRTLNGACTDKIECHPDFPECTPEGCKCAAGHIERGDKCFILANEKCNDPENSATCNTHSDCSNETETCLCDVNYTSNSAGLCKGLINAGCSLDADCHTEFNLECKNATTPPFQCGCKDGFKGTDDGLCLVDYNLPCNNTNPTRNCHPNFPICEADTEDPPVDRCACEANKQFEYETEECRIQLDKECDPDQDLCFPYSKCNQDSLCKCDQDYTQSGEICRGSHGASCRPSNPNDDCRTENFFTCDATAATCVCMNNYEHQSDGTCKGGLDATCTEGNHCITGHCKPDGTCGCPASTVPANNRCENVLGGPCEPACHADYGLECAEDFGNCTCATGKYEEGSKDVEKCFSGVGGQCATINDCVISSYCNTEFVCTCEGGFVPTGGRCIKGGGSAIQSTAFLSILSFVVAFLNFKM